MNAINRTFVILSCLFWSLCGCDDSPNFDAATTNRAINPPRSWTSENGRGRYEWKLDQQGQFTIPIRPTFRFLSELASQSKQTSLWPVRSANQEPWHRPEWMTDEVFAIFRRFTEPASKEVLLQLPAKQISHTLAFDLDRNGKTLVTLSDGKIELYDLTLQSPQQSFPCPLKDAYGILTTSSNNQFYLCNSKSIALIELADAKILAKEDTRFPVNYWEKAAECDTLLAVTTDNVMSVFDSELKLVDQCVAFVDSSSLNASLNPAGDYVLAINPLNLFHWTPRIPESNSILSIRPQSSGVMESEPQIHSVIAGKRFDCNWNSSLLRLFPKMTVEGRRILGSELFVRHNLDDMRIRSFGLGTNDSYLICGKQNTKESNVSEYVAFDFGTPSTTIFNKARFRRSKSIKLGREPLKRLITDQSGQLLATLNQSGLTVLRRTPWIGPPDASLCHELASTILVSGDFDQLEQCALELRSRDWPEHELWGEEVYRCFVQQVGLVNSNSSSDTSNGDKVSKWQESGSDLAVLSRVFHPDYFALWKGVPYIAMGNISGGTAIRQDYLANRLHSFESQLDAVLNGPRPPAIAFWIKFHLIRMRAKSIAEAEPILKRCRELYPNQLNIHRQVVAHMMSASGPGSVPAQAYISAIAYTFSKDLVDEATVLMMSELTPEQWGFIFASDAWLKEQEQVETTVSKWILDNEQNRIETFFQGQPELKNSLKKTGIDQYYERTFPFGL